MKLAVLADIHSNLVALEAVIADIDTWQPDVVAVAGDIVNRGPRPRECLAVVLERQQRDGWHVIRGNHERYLIEATTEPGEGIHADIRASVHWMLARLGGVEAILQLPEQATILAPDHSIIRIVHASINHDRDNILPWMSDAELRHKIDPYAALFCCGHTHIPVLRQIDNTLLVNTGSVGLPFDHDPRAAYARLEWHTGQWHAEIVRLEYDRTRARQDFATTGFLTDCGATAQVIQAEFDQARGLIAEWITEYQDRVMRGEMSVAESVVGFVRAKT